MTYQPRPFATGDDLANSRDQIRTNFNIINTDFAVNHVAFDETDEGKHHRIDMPEQEDFPATPANEGWLIAREYNSKTELAWRPESTLAAGDQYILSGFPCRAGGRFDGSGVNGLKSTIGIAFNVQNNQVNKTGNFTFDVTFAEALPSANYAVFIVADTGNPTVNFSAKTINGFTITVTSLNPILSFMVMGG